MSIRKLLIGSSVLAVLLGGLTSEMHAGCLGVCITVPNIKLPQPKFTGNPGQPIQPQGGQVGQLRVGPTPAPALAPQHPQVSWDGNSGFAKIVKQGNNLANKADEANGKIVKAIGNAASSLGGKVAVKANGRNDCLKDNDGECESEDNTQCVACVPYPSGQLPKSEAPLVYFPTEDEFNRTVFGGPQMQQAWSGDHWWHSMSEPGLFDDHPANDDGAPTREDMDKYFEAPKPTITR
jgi:hypothetical protein